MKKLLKGQHVWLVNLSKPSQHYKDRVREVTQRSVYLESSTRRFDPKTGITKEGTDKLKFFDTEEEFKQFAADAAL
ncbi:hypothetical protein [Siphonobacter sp. SORGH_AS_1065]|uniref:hypothetical protein n=1 Tax=Siphonobacter sp. SORGH_AS_1065 TaxID=3041795 RepID=UPI0027881075|nr:hypothetical protein [Siphonobacter sp. SORGH_AS_1065]MDQ1088590.1 hypothetical protein [Siphonobacter sp. SORGH_AS_1065]